MTRPEDVFEQHRGRLFAVAYRMLGTVADAEDAVQDAWLRWSARDRSDVLDPEAYLVRITGNVALDRLRAAKARRESYVGPWLPEPVLTSPDVAENAELAESVSMALLVVLETLSPLERAVFVLREVFGYPYAEVAAALERTEASVRQLATRARKHVEARRPRFEADTARRRAVTDRFFAAVIGGDVNELMALLSPDVVLWSDGGGRVKAALRVLHGPDKVARWLLGVTRLTIDDIGMDDVTVRADMINASPGLLLDAPDRCVSAVTMDLDDAGRISAIQVVLNPDKLGAVEAGRVLEL
ncbi:RNA polymerase sigma-70 factor [Actinomadura atramentaria]|uniref:RNA polymerase sigma-70 factor n=1 Tax=Actinomadura atramentaria TaxID=1990 RepID=UPI000361D5C5|nr:RNA polymerase sigma-70 factor [Actinomadura atramentaria]